MRREDVRTCTIGCILLFVSIVSVTPLMAKAQLGAADVSVPRVVSEARVSDLGRGPDWLTIASDPYNAARLLICGIENAGGHGGVFSSVLYGSTDSGRNWAELRRNADMAIRSETSCAIGRNGRMYFVTSGQTGMPQAAFREPADYFAAKSMDLEMSADGGHSWGRQKIPFYNDASLLAVGAGGKLLGDQIVIFGSGDGNREGPNLVLSQDDGRTFLPGPITLPRVSSNVASYIVTSNAVTFPDGSFGAVYLDPWPDNVEHRELPDIAFLRVSTRGIPLGPPSKVATISREAINSLQHSPGKVLFPQVGVGIVREGSRIRILLAWPEVRNGEVRIFWATSIDGSHWSPPTIIDDADIRNEIAFNPSIAVNKDGAIAVMWAERGGRCWRVAAKQSMDSAFGPSVALNPCEVADPGNIAPLPGHLYGVALDSVEHNGIGIVVADDRNLFQRATSLTADAQGLFHAVWVKHLSQDDSIYSTTIDVRGSKQKPEVLPVGRKVDGAWANFTQVEYDPALHEFVANMVIEVPTSIAPTQLVARAVSIESKMGKITVEDADNGLVGPGAAWRVTPLTRPLDNASAAGRDHTKAFIKGRFWLTAPRALRFKVEQPRFEYDGGGFPDRLLTAHLALFELGASEAGSLK